LSRAVWCTTRVPRKVAGRVGSLSEDGYRAFGAFATACQRGTQDPLVVVTPLAFVTRFSTSPPVCTSLAQFWSGCPC